MQKNWYILYTKSGYERKVSSLLTKKNIENFYAINTKRVEYQKKIKTITEPLFPSFIFVYTSCQQIERLKNVDHVLNLVHWKDKPAILPAAEIMAIKDFADTHDNISVEKVRINSQELNKDGYVSYNPILSGKVLFIKNRNMKVYLPSLGFVITASTEEAHKIISAEVLNLDKTLSLQ